MADIRDANPESHLCVGIDGIMKHDCGPEWLTESLRAVERWLVVPQSSRDVSIGGWNDS